MRPSADARRAGRFRFRPAIPRRRIRGSRPCPASLAAPVSGRVRRDLRSHDGAAGSAPEALRGAGGSRAVSSPRGRRRCRESPACPRVARPPLDRRARGPCPDLPQPARGARGAGGAVVGPLAGSDRRRRRREISTAGREIPGEDERKTEEEDEERGRIRRLTGQSGEGAASAWMYTLSPMNSSSSCASIAPLFASDLRISSARSFGTARLYGRSRAASAS